MARYPLTTPSEPTACRSSLTITLLSLLRLVRPLCQHQCVHSLCDRNLRGGGRWLRHADLPIRSCGHDVSSVGKPEGWPGNAGKRNEHPCENILRLTHLWQSPDENISY